jgi:hypothetical protein
MGIMLHRSRKRWHSKCDKSISNPLPGEEMKGGLNIRVPMLMVEKPDFEKKKHRANNKVLMGIISAPLKILSYYFIV